MATKKSRAQETLEQIKRREVFAALKHDQQLEVRLANLQRTDNIRAEIVKDDSYVKLVTSIRENGLQQPIVVTVMDDEVWLVAGHRRVEAMLDLGMEQAPAIYKDFKDQKDGKKVLAQIAENVNRQQLTALDLAEAYSKAKNQGNLKLKDLVAMFDRDETYIRRFIKIAGWPDDVKATIRERERLGKEIPIRKLVFIASKNLSAPEIRKQIALAIKPKERLAKSAQPIPRTPQAWQKRLDTYVKNSNVSNDDLKVIAKFCKDLGLGFVNAKGELPCSQGASNG